jgi:hypothetical protein
MGIVGSARGRNRIEGGAGVGATIVLTVDGELRKTRIPLARAGGTGRRDCGHADGI